MADEAIERLSEERFGTRIRRKLSHESGGFDGVFERGFLPNEAGRLLLNQYWEFFELARGGHGPTYNHQEVQLEAIALILLHTAAEGEKREPGVQP